MPLELRRNSVSVRPPGLVAKDQDPEPGVRPQPHTMSVDGNHVDAVSDFIYLVSSQSTDGQSRLDIRRRIGFAFAVMSSLDNIWKHKRLSLPIKLRVYLALAQSVLLYASETWTLTVADYLTWPDLSLPIQFGYTRWPQKRHQHLHALFSRVAEMNQHNSIYVMSKHQRICVGIFGLKLFFSSRDTNKIALQAIKQYLQITSLAI